MLVLAYRKRIEVIRIGMLEKKEKKKNSFTLMTLNLCWSPRPWQRLCRHPARACCTPGCKKGIEREERNVSARILEGYQGGYVLGLWEEKHCSYFRVCSEPLISKALANAFPASASRSLFSRLQKGD